MIDVKKQWALALACAVVLGAGCKGHGGDGAADAKKALVTNDEKALYAIGASVGGNMKPLELSAAELTILQRGITDAALGRTLEVDPQSQQQLLQTFMEGRAQRAAAGQKEKDRSYREAAVKEQGAVALPSGLVYRTLSAGSGATPAATDTVKVHYRGTLVNGTEFDSSIKRGQPIEFPLNGVIPCWKEGVQRMKVGEKAHLVCPSEIAYGDQGRPPVIPPGAALAFEVELIAIKGK
jgi:FKBP-type peptidyl-prolyl cis-trans isomerase FkpA